MKYFFLLSRHYALVPFTAAFIAGIAAGHHQPLPETWLKPAFFIIALLAMTACGFCITYKHRQHLPCLPLHILAFLLGGLLTSTALRLPTSSNVFSFFPEKRDAVIIGTMLSVVIPHAIEIESAVETKQYFNIPWELIGAAVLGGLGLLIVWLWSSLAVLFC